MLRCMLCLNKAWAACANNRSGCPSAERSMTAEEYESAERDLKMRHDAVADFPAKGAERDKAKAVHRVW